MWEIFSKGKYHYIPFPALLIGTVYFHYQVIAQHNKREWFSNPMLIFSSGEYRIWAKDWKKSKIKLKFQQNVFEWGNGKIEKYEYNIVILNECNEISKISY